MREGLSEAVTALAGIGLALIGVSGCGGGGGGNCGGTACGGDVVGAWMVTSSCISTSGSPDPMNCPQETAKYSNVNITGKATFKADMTYSSTLSFAADFQLTLPASCLMVQGQTVTCAQLQAALAADPSAGFGDVTCAAAGSGCTCSGKLTPSSQTETGTYSTAGHVLTQTAAGGQAESSDYCVQGNQLQILPTVNMNMPTMDFTVSGSITLTKQ